MTTTTKTDHAASFYSAVTEYAVEPLWQAKGLLPFEPNSTALPYVWRYEALRELLLESGSVVTAEEAERRVLMLINPGLDGGPPAATEHLYAGLQLLLPSETAPPHRHSAAAMRFVIEGTGAFTVVDGERTEMGPGDLVLTPSWTWHDHGSDGDEPVIWLDGLDLPLMHKLKAHFLDPSRAEPQQLVPPTDASARTYASARLNPGWITGWSKPYSPLIKYPWQQAEQQLRAAADDQGGSPTDGVIYEYTHPLTGGSVLPTMSCHVQLLKPGLHTGAHRHTSSAIYHVVSGDGYSVVDGERLDWKGGDTLALPGWALHEHANESTTEPAILFSLTDAPVLHALGLYREESVDREALS